MSQILAWGGMIIVFLAIVWGKIVLAAALDAVKTNHPQTYQALSDYGTPGLRNFSPVDSRVRRGLAAKMLRGRLPGSAGTDGAMAGIVWHWRCTVAGILGGFGLTALGLWLGAQG